MRTPKGTFFLETTFFGDQFAGKDYFFAINRELYWIISELWKKLGESLNAFSFFFCQEENWLKELFIALWSLKGPAYPDFVNIFSWVKRGTKRHSFFSMWTIGRATFSTNQQDSFGCSLNVKGTLYECCLQNPEAFLGIPANSVTSFYFHKVALKKAVFLVDL